MAYTVTYEGTTDRRHNIAESVEIDGVVLEKDEPQAGLSKDQVTRLEDLPYHRFDVKPDKKTDDKGGGS